MRIGKGIHSLSQKKSGDAGRHNQRDKEARHKQLRQARRACAGLQKYHTFYQQRTLILLH